MAFVLVHGGLLTGHVWRELVPLLDDSALAVDVPGRRDRPADHRSMSLGGNARDIVAQVDAAGMGSAHLVGHSLGGGTILALAALVPERIESLIFLAAPVPEDGGTIFSAVGEGARAFIGGVRDRGDASLPVPTGQGSSAIGKEIGVPEAVPPFFDPVPTSAIVGVPKVHYIRTAADTALEPALQDRAIAHLRDHAAVEVHPCSADHMVMLTDPQLLVDVLRDIAQGSIR